MSEQTEGAKVEAVAERLAEIAKDIAHIEGVTPTEALEQIRRALAGPVESLQKTDPETAARGVGDTICQQCGGDNPVWFTSNDEWNRIVGTPDNPRGEGVVLCPTCFAARVAEDGGGE